MYPRVPNYVAYYFCWLSCMIAFFFFICFLIVDHELIVIKFYMWGKDIRPSLSIYPFRENLKFILWFSIWFFFWTTKIIYIHILSPCDESPMVPNSQRIFSSFKFQFKRTNFLSFFFFFWQDSFTSYCPRSSSIDVECEMEILVNMIYWGSSLSKRVKGTV